MAASASVAESASAAAASSASKKKESSPAPTRAGSSNLDASVLLPMKELHDMKIREDEKPDHSSSSDHDNNKVTHLMPHPSPIPVSPHTTSSSSSSQTAVLWHLFPFNPAPVSLRIHLQSLCNPPPSLPIQFTTSLSAIHHLFPFNPPLLSLSHLLAVPLLFCAILCGAVKKHWPALL